MEVDQTATYIIDFFLQRKERLKLRVHLDLADREQIFPLNLVALHVSLNHYSCVVLFLLCVQSEETFLIECLQKSNSISTSTENFSEFASAADCSPTALETQNGVRYTFLQELQAESHFKLEHTETLHSLEVERYYK